MKISLVEKAFMMALYADIRKSQDRRMWSFLDKTDDRQAVEALVSKKLLEKNDHGLVRLTDIGINLATKFYVDQEQHFGSQVRVTMKETVKSRSREINEMAIEVLKKIEPQLDGIASQLKDTMELSHFIAMLGNRIAIFVSLKQGVREDAKEEIHTGICIDEAIRMIGGTDGKQGRSWNYDILRKVAQNCLSGCEPTTYVGKPESKEQKKFEKVWRKLQGKGCQRSAAVKPSPNVAFNQDTVMKMLGDTDGRHGTSWDTESLRRQAISCLRGDQFPSGIKFFNDEDNEERSRFMKVWHTIQSS